MAETVTDTPSPLCGAADRDSDVVSKIYIYTQIVVYLRCTPVQIALLARNPWVPVSAMHPGINSHIGYFQSQVQIAFLATDINSIGLIYASSL